MLPSAKLTASAPAIPYFRGSITRPAHSLSTLRRMGHPTATQDSLPDGRPAFPGGIDYPLGPNERFQVLSILLSQASPGALKISANGRCPVAHSARFSNGF